MVFYWVYSNKKIRRAAYYPMSEFAKKNGCKLHLFTPEGLASRVQE